MQLFELPVTAVQSNSYQVAIPYVVKFSSAVAEAVHCFACLLRRGKINHGLIDLSSGTTYHDEVAFIILYWKCKTRRL